MKTVSLKGALAMDFSGPPYIVVYSVFFGSRVLVERFYDVCMMPSHEISHSVMPRDEISRSTTLPALPERHAGAEAAW